MTFRSKLHDSQRMGFYLFMLSYIRAGLDKSNIVLSFHNSEILFPVFQIYYFILRQKYPLLDFSSLLYHLLLLSACLQQLLIQKSTMCMCSVRAFSLSRVVHAGTGTVTLQTTAQLTDTIVSQLSPQQQFSALKNTTVHSFGNNKHHKIKHHI